MDPDTSITLRRLLDTQCVAALATLHRGEPAVSMTPFVLGGDGRFVIHVSGLATHTRDMREHPRVSLLIVASPEAGVPPQARPRVSLAARAGFLEPGSPEAGVAGAAYLARFPDAAITFDLADFSLVTLEPESARLIAGFGRARTMAGDGLRAWLRKPA